MFTSARQPVLPGYYGKRDEQLPELYRDQKRQIHKGPAHELPARNQLRRYILCDQAKLPAIETDPSYRRLLTDLYARQTPGFLTFQRILNDPVVLY